MPMATIYSFIVIAGSLMYLVPVQFSFFRWIPPYNSTGGSKLSKVAVGALFGLAFIWLYNTFTPTPMSAIFATTLFGESEILTKIVYSILIPVVETRFFFRTIMQWFAWKAGDSTNVSPLSGTGMKLMVMFSAVFTVFHATAKGIDNTTDLAMTFVFGIISIAMILYFQEWIQAATMHIVVNSSALGIFDYIKNLLLSGAGGTWILVAAVALFLYWSWDGNKFKSPI